MNNRIRELAEQADSVVINKMMTGATQYVLLEDDLEKFAELIVRECIDIVSPYAVRMENFDGGHPIADLKKHFGVEE